MGGQGVRTPLKNHKNIGFHSNTGPDPLKKHQAYKPAFNVWPLSAPQRNTIWRADVGSHIVVFGSSLLSSNKKKKEKKTLSKLNLLWQTFLYPRMFFLFVCLFCCFTSQVNSYGHCGTVSSPNHIFFLGRLEQAVNQ